MGIFILLGSVFAITLVSCYYIKGDKDTKTPLELKIDWWFAGIVIAVVFILLAVSG